MAEEITQKISHAEVMDMAKRMFTYKHPETHNPYKQFSIHFNRVGLNQSFSGSERDAVAAALEERGDTLVSSEDLNAVQFWFDIFHNTYEAHRAYFTYGVPSPNEARSTHEIVENVIEHLGVSFEDAEELSKQLKGPFHNARTIAQNALMFYDDNNPADVDKLILYKDMETKAEMLFSFLESKGYLPEGHGNPSHIKAYLLNDPYTGRAIVANSLDMDDDTTLNPFTSPASLDAHAVVMKATQLAYSRKGVTSREMVEIESSDLPRQTDEEYLAVEVSERVAEINPSNGPT